MSMKPIKLENKLTVNGKEVTSVTLDFSKLTGRDLIKAEAEASQVYAHIGERESYSCSVLFGNPASGTGRVGRSIN